jgi:hypothetical protein
MNRILQWQTIMMDSVLFEPGKLSYDFFAPGNEDSLSVRSMSETDTLKWLLQHTQFKTDFFKDFFPGSPDTVKHFVGMVEPFTNPSNLPGDIDLLLINPAAPHQAIAFETKRVKVFRDNTGKDKINRLSDLKHGIKQANAYHQLGFHQSYLLVILLDDGRNQENPDQTFHYNKSPYLDREVYSLKFSTELDPNVGVVYIRLNQMTDKHINNSHAIHYCIDRRAIPIAQSTDMTIKTTNVSR